MVNSEPPPDNSWMEYEPVYGTGIPGWLWTLVIAIGLVATTVTLMA